jgi:hypothetical protein
MANIIIQTLYFMGSYAGLVSMLLFALNWITKGFIVKYLKVRASKGSKVLATIVSPTDNYYAIGAYADGAFKYTTRSGTGKTCTDVKTDDIFSVMSVFGININETDDTVIRRNGDVRAAISASSADDYYDRIIKAKELTNNLDKFIVGVLIIAVIGIVIIGFMMAGLSAELVAIKEISGII